MRHVAVTGCALIMSASAALCQRVQDPPAEVPSYEIRFAGGPIAIDGKADETDWQNAEAIHFIFPWSEVAEGERQQSTVARMLWDYDNLYIVYVCDDPYLDSEVTEHDGPVYEEDAMEIFANPNPNDLSAYFGYEMNLTPALLDYIALDADEDGTGTISYAWESEGVQIATTYDGTLNDHSDIDSGFTLEIAIPLDNFRHLGGRIPPRHGDMWRLNLNRTSGDRGRFSQWSDTNTEKPAFHRSHYFGKAYFSAELVGSE